MQGRRRLAGRMIEPSSFDAIVLGTGLPESMLAAAIAASGRSVLHLDSYDFYGRNWASLSFSQISSFGASGGDIDIPPPLRTPAIADNFLQEDGNPNSLDLGLANTGGTVANGNAGAQQEDGILGNGLLETRASDGETPQDSHGGGGNREPPLWLGEAIESELAEAGLEAIDIRVEPSLYSDVKVSSPDGAALGPLHRYFLDLAGPKLAFCGGPLIDALLRSQADHHVKFKAVEASYIWRQNGMEAVPASRADVFQDQSLSLPDKRFLMRFFKLVTDFTESQDITTLELAAGDLDQPFVELLQRKQLPPSVQKMILYAIALADDDQELVSDQSTLLTAREGLQNLALYLSSASRFPDAHSAFLYPMYGQGDLPQAFCRCAAVHGALYVLRMPVKALLIEKESAEYKGVLTSSGQLLYSGKLITGPSFRPGSGPPNDFSSGGLAFSGPVGVEGGGQQSNARCRSSDGTSTSSVADDQSSRPTKVARCICITDRSLQPCQSTILVIFPPRSLRITTSKVVRALQLGTSSEVCPNGKFVIYLSTVCSDESSGEESLRAATDALFEDGTTMSGATDAANAVTSSKPKLLWSLSYVQAMSASHTVETHASNVGVCNMPDGTVDYRSMMTSTEAIFHELFPEQQFFQRAAAGASSAEDDDLGDSDMTDGV